MREQFEPYIGRHLYVKWRDDGTDHVHMQQADGTDRYHEHEGVVHDMSNETLVFVDGTTVPLAAIDTWDGIPDESV